MTIGGSARTGALVGEQEVAVRGAALLEGVGSLPDLVALETAVRESSLGGQGAGRGWEDGAHAVLGEPVDLWDALFDSSFLACAQRLVSAQLAALELVPQARALLAARPAAPSLAALGSVQAAGWERCAPRSGSGDMKGGLEASLI